MSETGCLVCPMRRDLVYLCRLDRVGFFKSTKEVLKDMSHCGQLISVRTQGWPVERGVVDLAIEMSDLSPSVLAEKCLGLETDKWAGVMAFSNYDLPLLYRISGELTARGINVILPPATSVDICFSKRRVGAFVRSLGVASPEIIEKPERLDSCDFPVLVKPDEGQASEGVRIVRSLEELVFYTQHTRDAVVQRIVEGVEYTIDVFSNSDGEPFCVVPRERVWFVGSFSTVSRVRLLPKLIDIGLAIGGELRIPGMSSFQAICNGAGEMVVHDINPRMASGAPLSIRAGAPFDRWTVELLLGQLPRSPQFCIENGVTMWRHLEQVFA